MSDCDDLRAAARGLLDAEEAHRLAPTLENASLLARARRQVEEILKREPDCSIGSAQQRNLG